MKELSIEEKAYDANYKSYTELVNRLEGAKGAIKKQNYGIAMDILCKPYPEFQITASTELLESEDERIRKALIDGFKRYDDGALFNGCLVRDIVALLEKQCEKDELIKELSKYTAKYIREVVCKYPERQGEQTKKHDVCDNCEQQGSCVSPCPMKLVEKHSEQNPAWSEEDENRINRLIAYFEDKESFTAEDDIVYANWLKCLKDRYTWKPSDEQMDMLKIAVSTSNSIVLDSLYNDLMKLKE